MYVAILLKIACGSLLLVIAYVHTDASFIISYCILHGRIKRINNPNTTIFFEVGSYKAVVG